MPAERQNVAIAFCSAILPTIPVLVSHPSGSFHYRVNSPNGDQFSNSFQLAIFSNLITAVIASLKRRRMLLGLRKNAQLNFTTVSHLAGEQVECWRCPVGNMNKWFFIFGIFLLIPRLLLPVAPAYGYQDGATSCWKQIDRVEYVHTDSILVDGAIIRKVLPELITGDRYLFSVELINKHPQT